MSETSRDANDRADPIAVSRSDYDTFKARLEESPHDPESWTRLVDMAESSGNIARIREVYDALLVQYPNTVNAQIAYIDHFLPAAYREAEGLLNKFLKTTSSAKLWKYYLDYVRRMNCGPKTQDILRNAHELALSRIGQDCDSGSIWADYIQVLDEADTTPTWHIQHKTEALRKAYAQAVRIPLHNVDRLWKQYNAFETGINQTIGNELINELRPAHTQACAVLLELNIHLKGLASTSQSRMLLPGPATFSDEERLLVKRWKAYLRWEESNPVGIVEQDRDVLLNRIEKAYGKAVVHMRYYPEIWFMAFSWTASVGKNEAAILKAGLEPNPDSFVLTYAYVELLEKAELQKDQRDFTDIQGIYERFLGLLRGNLARLAVAAYPPDPSAKTPIEKDAKIIQDELAARRKHYSNAWINYIRFTRRTQDHQAYRDAFGKARKEEYIGWEVYEVAAITEWRCNPKDGREVAARIFEAGMKKFGSEACYVLAHLSFLLLTNDENDARTLFERTIATFTPQEARPIWERWSQFQYQHGDLTTALKLEQQMAEIYPHDSTLKLFAQRHRYYNIDAIADHDLGMKFAETRTRSIAPPVRPYGGVNPLICSSQANGNMSGSPSKSNKRPPSPLDRQHETAYKRLRPDERDGNRDRISPALSAPRHPSLSKTEANVKPPMAPRRNEHGSKLPAVLDWFLTQLPPRETFDGPVLDVDILMETLRTAVIPPTPRAPSPSPPSSRKGRPPPDYGPYKGPEQMPTRRRGGY
ncbi:Suf-domain-containing protein [Mycena vitilis]|nr:Suf-domain-containing protein [Mycena vitilis]